MVGLIQSFEFSIYENNPSKNQNYESDDDVDDDALDDKLELMNATEMLIKYNKSALNEFKLKWKSIKFMKSSYHSEFSSKINNILDT